MKLITSLLLSMVLILSASAVFAEDYGVYVKVIDKAQGSWTEVASAVENALKKAGWNVLASYNSAIPEDCNYHGKVIIFTSASYTKKLLSYGVKSAFALPLRVGIFTDNTGVNVAVLNPASINRTVLTTDEIEQFSLSTLNSISDTIASVVSGTRVNEQIGEIRSSGRVEGLGGGDFVDRIVPIYASHNDSDHNFKKLVSRVKNGIIKNKDHWKLIYTLDLSSKGVAVFGVTSEKMEKLSFNIARERGSKLYNIAVLYHNTAFPVEIVVYKEDGKIKVVTLDEMYRMKLYFQDAGAWEFIRHVRKPAQIQEEIVEMVIEGFMKGADN